MKIRLGRVTGLAKLWVERMRGWKLTQVILPDAVHNWINDKSAIATALVALMLLVIPLMFAIFIQISRELVARERLQGIAEFAAARAGRVVSLEIAKRATTNVVDRKIFVYPEGGRVNHPEYYLTEMDRQDLQEDLSFVNEVKNEAEIYTLENNASLANDTVVETVYPIAINRCDGKKESKVGKSNTIDVAVSLEYRVPSLFGELSKNLLKGSSSVIKASSIYSMPFCSR